MTKSLRKVIVRSYTLESKYLKNRTIENRAKYKKLNKFCSKLCKKERKNPYSNFELNVITDKKRFWKTIKLLLSDKYIQSSAITLVSNKNVISDDFELAQTFNNYYGSKVGKLGIKECETTSDVNKNSRSKDGIELLFWKYSHKIT